MKAVTLSHFTEKDKCYIVALGNGYKHSFSSKRAAKAFLAETSEFLTQQMHTVNLCLGEVFLLYRQLWAAFDNGTSKQCNQKLQDAAFQLDRIHMTMSLSNGNGNYYAFMQIKTAAGLLQKVLFECKEVTKARQYSTVAHQITTHIERVQAVKNALENYAASAACATFKLSVVEETTQVIQVEDEEGNTPLRLKFSA